MYKVVIIEDEPWTLIGITKTFNWKEMGFEIVAQTTKASEAIDIIHEKNPDVVFTDLRMPQISGIELMQKIRSEGRNIEFVIISGYAEFEYAREAITLGAFEYCLKPISKESACSILQRLATHLDDKRDRKDFELFESLVLKNNGAESWFTDMGLACKNAYYQGIVVSYLEGTHTRYEFTLPGDNDSICIKLGNEKYFYIKNTVEDLYNSLIAYKNSNAYVGLSSLTTGPQHFRQMFIEADKAAAARFMLCSSGVYRYVRENTDLINKILNEIIAEIKNIGQSTDYGSYLNNYTKIFEAGDCCIDDAIYLWNQVIAYLKRNYSHMEICEQLEFLGYEELLNSFDDVLEMLSYLDTIIYSCINEDRNELIYKRTCNQNFKKLIEYIDIYYMQKLQLKDLADKFYLNPNYCCFLFKSITGSSFSEYLTERRMMRACEFLKDKMISISEVALKVGYCDYYYFNKAFKKQLGYTPFQYRQRHD